MMRRWELILYMLMAVVSSGSAGQPISDSEVNEAWSKFEATWHELREGTANGADLVDSYDEHIEPLPFERMTSRQIASLNRMAFQFGTGMDRSLARLDSILDAYPDDLHAMIRLVDLLVWAKTLGYEKPVDASSQRIAPMIDRILAHPDLPVAVADGTASLLPLVLMKYGSDQDGHAAQRSAYEKLFGLIERSPSSSTQLAVEVGSRWQAVKAVGFEESRLRVHRDALLPLIQSALTLAEADSDPSLDTMNTIHRAEQALGMLTNISSTRDFVGSRAPELTIEWSSDDKITALADLRGKVVLLNFWVTGCGHCINALPRMRELAERYHGSNVAILGVTSLQGRHFEPGEGVPVSTVGDPKREHMLMQRFIASQSVSWPIVFTAESAWNSEYEVRGTPHLTLIDPDGTIVDNAMHPQDGLEEIAERVDSLLAEFGLDETTHNPGQHSRTP